MSQLTTSVSADWCCRLSPCAPQKPSWHKPLACWICALPCPPYELTKSVVNYSLRNCMMHSFFQCISLHFQNEFISAWSTLEVYCSSHPDFLCWYRVFWIQNICMHAVCVWSSSLLFVLRTPLSSHLLFHLASHQQKGPLMSLILLKVLFLFFPCDCCFWESGLLECSWRQYFLFCIVLFFNLKLLATHNTYSKTLHLYSWIVVE